MKRKLRGVSSAVEMTGFLEGVGKEEDKDEVEGRQKDESGTVGGVCGAIIGGSFENLEFSDGSGVVGGVGHREGKGKVWWGEGE